jgi:hypothetical protein
MIRSVKVILWRDLAFMPDQLALSGSTESEYLCSGAKSGAPEAQKAAQQADAGNGDESQNLPEAFSDCESAPLSESCNSL